MFSVILAVHRFLQTVFKSSGKAGEAMRFWDGISPAVVAGIEL